MKKELLLRLFPAFEEKDLESLPEELVVCWYPSSGTGTNQEILFDDNYSGYIAEKHWREQPTKLKPNLFIFSDVCEFEFHESFKLICSKTIVEDKIISLLNNPIIVDYGVFSKGDLAFDESFEKVTKFLFARGLLDINDSYQKIVNQTSAVEYEQSKLEIKILLEAGLIDKESVIKDRKRKETCSLEDGTFGPVPMKRISIINLKNNFYILVQATNKYLYERFIEQGIHIPLLTINRPMDGFVFNRGINLEKLGVEEFIAGQPYVSSLIFGEEFKKHSDFVFQYFEDPFHEDMANLYSC